MYIEVPKMLRAGEKTIKSGWLFFSRIKVRSSGQNVGVPRNVT